MKDSFFAVSGVLLGLGGGLLFDEDTSQLLGLLLLGLGAFLIIALFCQDALPRLYRRLWPGRDDWTIESDYKTANPIGEFEGKWNSNEVQKADCGIVIDIGKGKQEVLSIGV